VLLERNPSTGALARVNGYREDNDTSSSSASNDDAANDSTEKTLQHMLERLVQEKSEFTCNERKSELSKWSAERAAKYGALVKKHTPLTPTRKPPHKPVARRAWLIGEGEQPMKKPITQQNIDEPWTVYLADIRANSHLHTTHDRLVMSEALPAVVNSTRHHAAGIVQSRSRAKELPSWSCLVTGFHALLGCDGALRA
jgi:hypothetical protein